MDNDELFRHLRKDHFYCHFCDVDGIKEYYPDYNALRDHFKDSHFLCEEGNCKNEQFTSAFRSKIDFQAHFLANHAENKSEIRAARTIDLQFSLSSRPVVVETGGFGRGGRRRGGGNSRYAGAEAVGPEPQTEAPPQQSVDITCAADFPTLGKDKKKVAGSGSAFTAASGHRAFNMQAMSGSSIASRAEEFPSLLSSSARGVYPNK